MRALLITSKAWSAIILSHERIKAHYVPMPTAEWTLNREPVGKTYYDELKAIHTSNTRNKQQAFEEAALKSPEHARLILFNPQWWEDFTKNNLIVRAAFIYKVARQWSEAMYYALDNDGLRTQWLPVMLKFKHEKFGYFFESVEPDEHYDVYCFGEILGEIFHRYTIYRGDPVHKDFKPALTAVAWLWATKPALLDLLIERKDSGYLGDYISFIIEAANADIISLLSTQPVLNFLDSENLASCLHSIFTRYSPSSKEAIEIAQLWLTDSELKQKLATLPDNKNQPTNDHSIVNHCILRIISIEAPSIAKQWSSDPVLYTILAHPKMNDILPRCIGKIIENGGQEIAMLWVTQSKLHDLIRQMTKQERLNCLEYLITVGGEGAQESLRHSTFRNDLESPDMRFSALTLR